MANMFSGNREKKIPKSLKECYASDSVTENLWIWCERLETIGKFFAIITVIATIITGIALAESTDGISIVIAIFAAPIAAFLEYISFHIVALLVGSLASIVQNTKISANIAAKIHL